MTKNNTTIRRAQTRDLGAMLEIYNREVINGDASFDIDPKSADEWARWYEAHSPSRGHIVLVADVDGQTVGYACLSPFRDKQAYDTTAELSVYVDRRFRSRGVATLLVNALVDAAKRDGIIHNIVSVITDGNEASERLHDRLGFVRCGVLPEVGVKFGRRLGVVFYSLIID